MNHDPATEPLEARLMRASEEVRWYALWTRSRHEQVVREQLEHDRVIRLLHAKFRRKYEAAMNPGMEQNAAVGAGTTALYPDLLLMSLDRGHKLQVVVEAENRRALEFYRGRGFVQAADDLLELQLPQTTS